MPGVAVTGVVPQLGAGLTVVEGALPNPPPPKPGAAEACVLRNAAPTSEAAAASAIVNVFIVLLRVSRSTGSSGRRRFRTTVHLRCDNHERVAVRLRTSRPTMAS